jgi:RNA polymerase sigma factor (sigma-70 family)
MTSAILEEKGDLGLAWALGRLAQHRDLKAWGILVDQTARDIERLACRLMGDHALAEDAVQETLLLIRDHAGSFSVRSSNGNEDARRWVMSIAVHASIKISRRHVHQLRRDQKVGHEEARSKPPINDPSQQVERVEESQLLRRELVELPDIYGQAITLHYLAGQDYPALAAQLSMSINAVRNRVHRGLKLLRERLERCEVSLSIAALTGLLSNLGASSVAAAATPTSDLLGIINSSATANTTMATASVSFVTTGTVLMGMVVTAILAVAISAMSVMGWPFDMFNAVAESSVPVEEVVVPSPPITPGADAKASVTSFIIVVKTDEEKEEYRKQSLVDRGSDLPSGKNQFRLPLSLYYSYDFTINWGDGSKEVFTTKGVPEGENDNAEDLAENLIFSARPVEKLSPIHAYAKIGTYTIEITENVVGGFPAIAFNNGGDCHKLISIAQWGGGTWKTMQGAFAGCYNLTISANDSKTALMGSVNDFSSAWSECRGLTSFPSLNTAEGTNFSWTWYGCSGLTSFPLLNTAKGTDFNHAWAGCRGLTSFPLLNTAKGTRFSWAWYGCSGLTSFPLLNTAAGTKFDGAWWSCTDLTNFPLLNTAAGTEFDTAWYGCSGLTSFPLLNTAEGTNFGSAWLGCTGLTNFPLLNTAKGRHFASAWADCTGLTNFPLLNTAAGFSFSRAWSGCRGLTSFPLLDTAEGRLFDEAWYGCKGLTSFPLLNTAKGKYFFRSWSGCTGLTNFPVLHFGNMAEGSECFAGVTLNSDAYSDLIIHLADVNHTPEITFDGGVSKANAKALAARKILTTDRGWTIYDADSPRPILPEKKPLPTPIPEEANDF